jgi:hypothetical protein
MTKGFQKIALLIFTFMGGTLSLVLPHVAFLAVDYFLALNFQFFNPLHRFLMTLFFSRVNHHIVCTLRGYRRLDARFDGQPVIGTGFKMVYDGHSQLQSGPLPAGNPGEFDVITCQDLDSGELQQFKLAYD